MQSLPEIFEFKSNNIIRDVDSITVLGCGGTGAYTIAFLSRIISTLKNRKIEFTIADGDIVEEKNLQRQHFISSDIGKNKAEVLAERYSSAFGIPINSISEEIKTTTQVKDLVATGSIPLIIGCVDNNASRKLIYDSLFVTENNSRKLAFWIDSGNEENSGQVVLGFNAYPMGYNPYCPFSKGNNEKVGIFSLPCVMDIYPEMLRIESAFNSDLSCAERAASAPQNMMTNITAATLITNYAQKLIFNLGVKSHATEFTINNVFTTRLNTRENLASVPENRKQYWEKTN